MGELRRIKEEGVERERDKNSVCPSDAWKHYRTDSFSDSLKMKSTEEQSHLLNHELELKFLVQFLNPL